MKKIVKRILVVIIMIILYGRVTNTIVYALHAPFNPNIYADQNYGIPQDTENAKVWTDLSVERYGQTKATRQSDEDALTEWLNGSKLEDCSTTDQENAKTDSKKKAAENYYGAITMELSRMHRVLIGRVKEKELKDFSTEDLKKYLNCLEKYISNPGFTKLTEMEDETYSGEASVYSLAVSDRIKYIKDNLNDKLSEEQKEQVDNIDQTTTDIIDKDQDTMIEQGSNDDGHLDKYKEKPMISGTVILGTGKDSSTHQSTSPTERPDYYDPSNAEQMNSDNIVKIASIIINALNFIGIIVAVVVLTILGIKYMLGSASEKAEYKKTMIPYLVGVILLAIGTLLIRLVYNLIIGTGVNNI